VNRQIAVGKSENGQGKIITISMTLVDFFIPQITHNRPSIQVW